MIEGEILQKENSCFNHLRWRINIQRKISFEEFIAQLTQINYHEKVHPLFPKIIEMQHNSGHRIIFVPKTNRIQLKLSVDSVEKQRIEQAKQIAQTILTQLNNHDYN